MNYYKILGINDNASNDDIKRAYKKLAIKYHPDKPGGNNEKFKLISQAFNILRDPIKRKQYDLGHLINIPKHEQSYDYFDKIFNIMNRHFIKSNMMDNDIYPPNFLNSLNSRVIKKSVSSISSVNGEKVTKQQIYTNINGKENKKSRVIRQNKSGIYVNENINGNKKSYYKSNKRIE
jgi:curved DNA-binding protein CbpA